MTEDVETNLHSLLAQGTVVPVIGAGVSVGAAQTPSWTELITRGFDYADSLKIWDDEVANARTAFQGGGAKAFTQAAQDVQRLLHAPNGNFPVWLKAEFEIPLSRVQRPLVNAIADLCAPIIATTNYDKLFTISYPGRTVVTWKDSAGMANLLKRDDSILHLHGVYDRPDTVIFGVENYADLVVSTSYRSILQTLWLTKTLLFVGCSFDGLRDPDFSRLIEWTTQEFTGLTHEHYALVRVGQIDKAKRRDLLFNSRIRVVEFGSSFGDLEGYLSRINPNLERARTQRKLKQREILGSDDGSAENFLSAMPSVTGTADFSSRPEIQLADVQPLFDHHSTSLIRKRNQLVALQTIVRSMVNEDELRVALQAWQNRQVEEHWKIFYRSAMAAGDALDLFPVDVLSSLWRLDTGVHTYAVTGDLRVEYEHARDREHLARADTYTQENLSRIIRSLLDILDADANALLPVPVRGRRMESADPTVVVVWTNGMDLRLQRDPDVLVGFLPETPPSLRGAEATTLNGTAVLIAFNSERVSAWKPQLADAPVASFRLDSLPSDDQSLLGIYDVAHWRDGGKLHSSIVVGSKVHWLIDLDFEGSTELHSKDTYHQTSLGAGRLYAVNGGKRVVRVSRDGVTLLIDSAALQVGISKLPTALPADTELDNFRLFVVPVGNRKLLGIRARAHGTLFGSVLAVIDDEAEPGRVVGAWILPSDVVVDCHAMLDSDDSTLLTGCCLRKYDDTKPQILRARGVTTARGMLFAQDLTVLEHDSDLFSIVMTSPTVGFTADTRGRLHHFDLAARTSRVIESTSKVSSLTLFPPAP